MTPRVLTVEGEAAWARLHQHVSWAQGFSLGFVLSGNSGVVDVLRARLADTFRAGVSGLETVQLARPEQLTNELLPRLLSPPLHQQVVGAPCWVDLSRELGTEWEAARLNFVARLNEQREMLRGALGRVLILVFPLVELPRLRALAPDLWAVRDFTVEVGDWFVPLPVTQEPRLPPPRFPLDAAGHAAVAEWERLRTRARIAAKKDKKWIPDRGMVVAGTRATGAYRTAGWVPEEWATLGDVMALAKKRAGRLPADLRAMRDLTSIAALVAGTAQQLGRWDEAQRALSEAVDALQRRIHSGVPSPDATEDLAGLRLLAAAMARDRGDTEEAERNLAECREVLTSTSSPAEGRATQEQRAHVLDLLSWVAESKGDLEAASNLVADSLRQSRSIVARFRDDASLRRLAGALDAAASLARKRGDWPGAERASVESADLRRRAVATGDSPASLREMVEDCHRRGEDAETRGNTREAAIEYREAVSIARALLAESGETPNNLARLAYSLALLADVSVKWNQWTEADPLLAECLDLRRHALAKFGPGPGRIRDLSVALDNIGDAASKRGLWDDALRAFHESLELCRTMTTESTPTPESLRDLAVSLDHVGDVELHQHNWEAAADFYAESLELSRIRVRENGETPEALRDLGISQQKLGVVRGNAGDTPEALATFTEALRVSRRLTELYGPTAASRRLLATSLGHVAEAHRKSGERHGAAVAASESLTLFRALLRDEGETPETLFNLAQSLRNLAECGTADAPQLLREAQEIATLLTSRYPEQPDVVTLLRQLQHQSSEPQSPLTTP